MNTNIKDYRTDRSLPGKPFSFFFFLRIYFNRFNRPLEYNCFREGLRKFSYAGLMILIPRALSVTRYTEKSRKQTAQCVTSRSMLIFLKKKHET